MKLALVGATGLVGSVMKKVLEERNMVLDDFYPVASERSIGKKMTFAGKEYEVISLENAVRQQPDVAIFSAGSAASLKWAPEFARNGCYVIDNSSAWRMQEDVPLVVPEVNKEALRQDQFIIANPNCSTIQLVVALAPLHKKYRIKRLVISTYQSVTGTGVKAVNQMEKERMGEAVEKVYPYQIDLNCLPHGGDFLDNGYTSEEMKLVNETRKILDDPSINVTATVVRVPVIGGHSESVNIEFYENFELNDVMEILANAPGVKVEDDPQKNIYPMPLTAHEKDLVYVGRIRRDESQKHSLNMWVVSDNLRKGAATNAVQILESLQDKGWVG